MDGDPCLIGVHFEIVHDDEAQWFIITCVVSTIDLISRSLQLIDSAQVLNVDTIAMKHCFN